MTNGLSYCATGLMAMWSAALLGMGRPEMGNLLALSLGDMYCLLLLRLRLMMLVVALLDVGTVMAEQDDAWSRARNK